MNKNIIIITLLFSSIFLFSQETKFINYDRDVTMYVIDSLGNKSNIEKVTGGTETILMNKETVSITSEYGTLVYNIRGGKDFSDVKEGMIAFYLLNKKTFKQELMFVEKEGKLTRITFIYNKVKATSRLYVAYEK